LLTEVAGNIILRARNDFERQILAGQIGFSFNSMRSRAESNHGSAATIAKRRRYFRGDLMEETRMRKALMILATIAAVGATAVTAPAPAEARGLGPGLAFGLAAGALTAGAIAGAYGPYYGYGPRYGYGPGYGYYGYPAGYAYGPGPYAYYGGPYYRHRYYRHYW
jgi:hypothetical protein